MSNPYVKDSWEWHAWEAAEWITAGGWGTLATDADSLEAEWTTLFVTDPDLDWPIATLAYRARLAYEAEGADPQVVMIDRLASKQRDYGPQNILKFGREGIKVRSSDKIERIKNLIAQGSSGSAEPLRDAYYDIWGYMIVLRMLQLGVFENPLQEQMTVSEETAADDVVRYGDRFYFKWVDGEKFIAADGVEYSVYTLERA